MNKNNMKRLLTVAVVLTMAVSGGIETKAAQGSKINLYGIHDPKNNNHSYFCQWMSGSEKCFKQYDSTAIVEKFHHNQGSFVHNALKSKDYVLISTHGSTERLQFMAGSREGNKVTYLTTEEISNGGIMKNLKVCHIAACNSWNVAKAINQKGGKATIGYRDKIYIDCSKTMLRRFSEYFAQGQTVTRAMYNAKNKVMSYRGRYGGIDKYVIYGEGERTF